MALDFPSNPSVGQIYQGPNNIAWTWDSAKWAGGTVAAPPVPISGGGTGATTAVGALAAILPVGLMLPYAGATAPAGWLLCYGQNVSRTTYAVLFAAIGTTYGAGNGSTTFTLPDLRGRFVSGMDTMGGVAAGRLTSGGSGVDGTTLGATGGNELSIIGSGNLPAHSHGVSIVSGNDNQDHSHYNNFNSQAENANHTHNHSITGTSGGFRSNAGTQQATSGTTLATQPGGLSTETAAHVHQVAGNTNGINNNHNHTVTGSTDNGPGSGSGLPIVAPTMVATYIIFAGA